MFKPSPILGARLRLTTKQVNGGYYKGNRTGSMGAHTEYGGYVIDYRKVRQYNCPDLTDFKLTPFITRQMEPTQRTQTRPDGTTFTPKLVDGMEYLQQWRLENSAEYEQVINHQRGDDTSADDESVEESPRILARDIEATHDGGQSRNQVPLAGGEGEPAERPIKIVEQGMKAVAPSQQETRKVANRSTGKARSSRHPKRSKKS